MKLHNLFEADNNELSKKNVVNLFVNKIGAKISMKDLNDRTYNYFIRANRKISQQNVTDEDYNDFLHEFLSNHFGGGY